MTFARILIVLAALSWPFSASAAAPAGVAGLFAEVQGREIHIRWNAPQEDEDIFVYRVYYSTQSILENGGAYEDFETTDGRVMEHILRDFPAAPSLFLSVLAVNSAGEESEFFLEEVEVEIPAGSQTPVIEEETPQSEAEPITESPTETPAEPGMQDADVSFTLLAAQAISSTGVVLEFSLLVDLAPENAATAIRITDASGAELPLVRLQIQGSLIRIDTLPQMSGKVYGVEVTSAVRGKQTEGVFLNIDPNGTKALFTGFTTFGKPVVTPVIPNDVEALNLRATIVHNRYTVQATWRRSGQPETVHSFELRHSVDGGKTYSAIQAVAGDATAVEFKGVAPGSFTFHVRAVSPTGHTSRGVVTAIELPALTQPNNGLPGSGMGVATALLLTGATMGIRKMRRRLR
ncbi:hypothetical protein A3D88_00530 [Candidatus Peribacteria bacterium RIFCSPHIGHO2_02_FULL_52_16]|nr:MAG: hypothetical protein A2706_01395 [Candidatus Peribacteria bacterium RIFCSPHIGHO2_01_FULL_51_35]OGJ61959.1 MAG: hypothetical protein A3D88_00530 [Candidatus Peribacteria bacterium RIFCSPHIGHO2_02_FULL_52_16]